MDPVNTEAMLEFAAAEMWEPPVGMDFEDYSADYMFRSEILPTLAADDPITRLNYMIQFQNQVPAAAINRYLYRLDELAASDHPSKAWACVNWTLDTAVCHSKVRVVQALLRVPTWQLCPVSSALSAAIFRQDHAELLHLLVSDPRFDESMLRPLVQNLVEQTQGHMLTRYGRKRMAVLHVLLSIPRFPPKLVWEGALAKAMEAVLKPSSELFALPSLFQNDDLLNTATWQFERAQIQDQRTQHHSSPFVPPRLLTSPACPKLITELPLDIQFMLHEMLDAAAARSLRLTCRALRQFPAHRFAQRRVKHALHGLATAKASHAGYARVSLQHLIESVPRHLGPSTLDYRALVEAVRYLDADLALKFLRPRPKDAAMGYDLLRASHPNSIGYVVSWALFVLLKKLDGRDDDVDLTKGGILLEALLLHPLLDDNAWSFTVVYFDACRKALRASAASVGFPGSTCGFSHTRQTTSQSITVPSVSSTPQFLIHLLRAGALLDAIPPAILSDLRSSNESLEYTSNITRICIMLSALSYNPATFATVVDALALPPDSETKRQLLALLCSRPDPTQYLTHVLTTLAPVPDQILLDLASHDPTNPTSVHAMAIPQLIDQLDDPCNMPHLVLPVSHPVVPTKVVLNATILTRWLRWAATVADDGQSVLAGIDWHEREMVVEACIEELQEMKRLGDEHAGQMSLALIGVWDPIRAMHCAGSERERHAGGVNGEFRERLRAVQERQSRKWTMADEMDSASDGSDEEYSDTETETEGEASDHDDDAGAVQTQETHVAAGSQESGWGVGKCVIQ